MRKIIIFLFLSIGFVGFSQALPNLPIPLTGGSVNNLTPNGLFDNVFDQNGKQYKLSDIMIIPEKKGSPRGLAAPISTPPLDCGYYRLYFEAGCGFENDSNPVQNTVNLARRAVLKQVFEDLSAFINSPLTLSGNKVNIQIRNLNADLNIANPTLILGAASSFYVVPKSATGTIADNEIWKTIHFGSDSVINSYSPGVYNSFNGFYYKFYHGKLSFNFGNPNIVWNTNLSVAASSNQVDLYSAILHEVTHALGFASLIKRDGNSNFANPAFKYYSRYDMFLKDKVSNNIIISSGNTFCSLYNYNFNSLLSSSVLNPSASCPNPVPAIDYNTNCPTAVIYVSSLNNVTVYRPDCFQQGSSLSHFEDTCFNDPTTGLPTLNNLYFAMSNATGSGAVFTKRFLKPEERNVLGDIGYNVNSVFGNVSQLTYKDYSTSILQGINVAGKNDGFIGNSYENIQNFTSLGIPIPIQINNVLSNDINANAFECLEDVDNNSILTISGNTITFSSNHRGVHVLRYVPINNITNVRGNITYLFVYVQEYEYSGLLEECNLVINGDFEQYSSLPLYQSQLNGFIKGWKTVVPNELQSNDYFNADNNTTTYNLKVPCNFIGYETDKMQKKGYIGMYLNTDSMAGDVIAFNSFVSENIKTKLKMALLPNTKYQLSFDISAADKNNKASKIQAYISTKDITTTYLNNGIIDYNIPTPDLNMLKTNSVFSVTKNGWERVVFEFNTGTIAGQQYLYLGGLNNNNTSNLITNSSYTGVPSSCSFGTFINHNPYYYIDNVELRPVITPVIFGNSSACSTLNAITTNNTVLLTGQTASWTITSGAGTIIGSNTTTAAVTWSNLPGTLKLTITDTATGCSKFITKTITSDCTSCNCLNGLSLNYSTQPSNNLLTYSVNIPSNSICNSLEYAWSFCGGGSTITTTNTIVCDPSIHYIEGVVISQYNAAKVLLCSTTLNTVCPEILASPASRGILNDKINFGANKILETKKITVNPNPSKGIFVLKTDKIINKVSIMVTTLNGGLIYESKNQELENETTVDLSSYPSGVYLLKIFGENIDYSVKLIKE